MKKALILLGCPEAPAQTPMAVYATYKLTGLGYEVTVASTPSAMKLLEVTDPLKYYIKNKIDIESCLNNAAENSYDFLLGFVHKDAAVSYFVTFYHVLSIKSSMAVVFERDAELLKKFIEDLNESTETTIVSARAYHNPTPLKVKFDRAINQLGEQ
jgi:hypothetical protein